MLRKPYLVVNHNFSNGVRLKTDAVRFNQDGYLTHSAWATPEQKAQ